MDAAEVEFLAEKELVTIIPNFSLDKIYLIGVRTLVGSHFREGRPSAHRCWAAACGPRSGWAVGRGARPSWLLPVFGFQPSGQQRGPAMFCCA